MRSRGRFARVATPVLLTITLFSASLTGCTTLVGGSATAGIPALEPDAQRDIIGDGGTEFDQLAKNALTDIETFWSTQYPTIADGESLEKLAGNVYSADDSSPDAGIRNNACVERVGVRIIKDNAMFCQLDDSIIYDRVGFIPTLVKKYGDYMVAAMFAHEYGHAVQFRLGNINSISSIAKETQADCASGAFTSWVLHFKAPHVRVTPAALDRVLAGYIQLRDPEPHNKDDGGTHGNGFDRVGAFAAGVNGGAKACFTPNWTDRKFTERGYASDADYSSGGDVPEDDVLAATPTSGSEGSTLLQNLNQYWSKAAASIGKTWKDVTIVANDPTLATDDPPCAPNTTSSFVYCPVQNTIYYGRGLLDTAYEDGDFSLGTLLAFGWGMAVRSQLFGRSLDDSAALLAAACYTGAYSESVNIEAPTPDQKFVLSPQDMDEATISVLSVVPLPEAFGARGTTGLTRITAFNKGYFGGLAVC